MKRVLIVMALATLALSNTGCCGRRPLWQLFGCNGCGGCGERYYGDWAEGRPLCQDCCNCCGQWTGAAPGFVPNSYSQGYTHGNEQWSEEQVVDPTPAPATQEQVAPESPTPAQRPAPANTSGRATRARPISRPGQPAPASNYRNSGNTRDRDSRYQEEDDRPPTNGRQASQSGYRGDQSRWQPSQNRNSRNVSYRNSADDDR